MEKELLHRFFDGRASVEEEKQVLDWIDRDPANRRELLAERRLFDSMLMLADPGRTTRKPKVLTLPRWTREVLKYAAVILVIAGAGGIYVSRMYDKFLLTGNTITVPAGQHIDVQLPDGTKVWLNASSRLTYPETFDRRERRVTLEGEAYFEVTRNEQASFSVHTRDMNLQVLGTSFNIKAYPDETETVTTLLSGSIEQHYPSSRQTLRLLPSQQSHFDCHTGNLQILEADPEEVLAWKNGKFIARDKTLEEIFRELTRWYDFEVVFTRPALRQLRFHLHTNRYASIREILDNLQSTNGIHFSYIGNKIYISQ